LLDSLLQEILKFAVSISASCGTSREERRRGYEA